MIILQQGCSGINFNLKLTLKKLEILNKLQLDTFYIITNIFFNTVIQQELYHPHLPFSIKPDL